MGTKTKAVKAGKSQRINVRLEPCVKAYIERAAIIDDTTISRFIIESAIAAAEKIITSGRRSRRHVMTEEETKALYASLVKPPDCPKALERAFAEYKRMEYL